ncbi:MAG: two-component regulator propeller domain-containing protein [Bacteroidota bacterium]|nr:two-component regulator propeller domain-containing protein [Bacteroidota bacterium]
MKYRLTFLTVTIIFLNNIFAQSDQWIHFNTSNSGLSDNSVSCIAIDKNNTKWFGTYNKGLCEYDGVKWTNYNKSNSVFPDKSVRSIAIDQNNIKWIGTRDGGLVRFDGKKMKVWDTLNSSIHSNWITSIAVDKNNIKWLSTRFRGIMKFDGEQFTVIDSTNSKLPVNQILSLVFDNDGIMWAGTTNGLVKFDQNHQTVYNKSNSPLPENRIWSVTVDNNNNKWIGTDAGLIMFDGKNWSANIYTGHWTLTSYTDHEGNNWIGTYCGGLAKNESNYLSWVPKSESDAGAVYFITADNNGNEWFATSGGVYVKKQNNQNNKSADLVVSTVNKSYYLGQNYPNPFSNMTSIEYQLAKPANVLLIVRDILGNEVATLINSFQGEGFHKIDINTEKLSSGIYFYTLSTGEFTDTKKMTIQK